MGLCVARRYSVDFVGFHVLLTDLKYSSTSVLSPDASIVIALADGKRDVECILDETLSVFSTSSDSSRLSIAKIINVLTETGVLISTPHCLTNNPINERAVVWL